VVIASTSGKHLLKRSGSAQGSDLSHLKLSSVRFDALDLEGVDPPGARLVPDHSSSRGSPNASGLAAPHRELNHLVDISTRTAMVMTNGTVLQMYRESTLGRTS
jgi:hypothetical protein